MNKVIIVLCLFMLSCNGALCSKKEVSNEYYSIKDLKRIVETIKKEKKELGNITLMDINQYDEEEKSIIKKQNFKFYVKTDIQGKGVRNVFLAVNDKKETSRFY